MKIKQVCEQSGLTSDTIRFYEKIGLFSVEKGSYFKLYSEQTVETLIAIKKLRAAGLSISEIKELSSIETEYDELSQEQLNSIIDILDNNIKRVETRANEIAEARQLLKRMQNKLWTAYHENC